MTSIRNAAIFRHSMSDGAGTIGEVLVDRGSDVALVDCFDRDLSGFDALGPDLAVFLGGACGVYQRDLYPFLDHEIDILKRRIDAGRPVLGICLGAQLIAASQGKDVYRGTAGEELGWYALELTDAGRNSVARHFDGALTRVMQRHGDTFDMPDNAAHYAGSAQYRNQIFGIGKHVLAFQCHVEMNRRVMNSWYVSLAHKAAMAGYDLHALRAETDQWLPVMQGQTRLALNEWLDAQG